MLSLLFSAAAGFTGPVSRVQRTPAPMMLAAPSANADVAYAAELKLAAESVALMSVRNAELERPYGCEQCGMSDGCICFMPSPFAAFNEAIRQ